MAKMSANMEKLSDSIGAGFHLLQGLLAPERQLRPQQQMYNMTPLPSASVYNPYSPPGSEASESSSRMFYPMHFAPRHAFEDSDENSL